MKNYYLKPLKCLLMWVLFLSITPIMAQDVTEYIKVSGLPSYSPFNGVYKKADTYGAYGHASWKNMDLNGGDLYIYSNNDMGINCWMLGYRNSNHSILYWSYYSNGNDYSWGDQNSFKPLVSPLMMETWMLYDWGNGTETPVSITLNEVVVPTLVTTTASSITTVSASLGGNITSDGGDDVYGRGVVYSSTDDTPTIGETNVVKTYNGRGTGSFSETITGLTPATTYYYQAYATNAAGTTYGGVHQFSTEALPVISSVAVPSDKAYKAGNVLSFTVTTNKAVTVTGSPKLALTIGNTAREASYVSASSTSTDLVFCYTVGLGDFDADGIAVNSLSLNGGTIKDDLNNDCDLSLIKVASTTGVIVDTYEPNIVNVSSSSPNGWYKLGDVISITVDFSESVNVTGTPTLELYHCGTATYSSGSGSSKLVFSYTVAAGHANADLDYSSSLSLSSAGGSIVDAAGNRAILILPTPGASGSLGGYNDIMVDGIAPLISGVTNNGTYTSAQTPTFNEGTATLAKNGGMAAVFTSGTSIGATGNYVLKVTDAAGNVTTASFAITITTGVDDQRETSLVIYPNPCTDVFNVSGIDAPANVTITDLTGRVVLNTLVDVDGIVPVGSLKQGTYLVKVNDRVLKIIKK